MKPADLALLRIPGVPTVSPDGRRAVVAVTRLDLDADEYRSQLWLVDSTGAEPARPITHGEHDSAPQLSPDGRSLAFLRAAPKGKPQLHVMPLEAGEPRKVTDLPLGAGAPVWSPDSTRIAFVARVPELGRYGTAEGVTPEKEPPRRITTLHYRLDDVGFILDRRSHVYLVDPFDAEPNPVQVTDGDYDDEEVTWSPDGARLAFASARHPERETTLYRDVYSCAADGSDLRLVTPTTLWTSRPAYAQDGRTILFLGTEMGPDGRDFVARSAALYAVPIDGSAPPRPLTDASTLHLLDQNSGLVLVGSTQEPAVLVGALRRGAVELLRVPLPAPAQDRTDAAGGRDTREPEPTQLIAGPRQVVGYAAAGGVVVATVADPSSSGELVAVADPGGGTFRATGAGVAGERALTAFSAELREKARPRPMEEITATAPDGYPVHGWLIRPEGKGPHPVLLMIHGGPYMYYGWSMFDEAQVYTGAGYAVVMGNPRGSAGYGEQHGRAIRHALGTVDTDDLLALLDAALARADLDGDRVGAMGGSYGGFMATWLAAHAGHRFRAAISERALNAWDSFTGSSDIGSFFTDGYAGCDRDMVHAQSPLYHADRICIPMLLIHSEQDWRCPVEQAQRLFVALRQRGVEAELLLFPGEGHELSRSGLPSHRLARFEAVLDWWSRHLSRPAAGVRDNVQTVAVSATATVR